MTSALDGLRVVDFGQYLAGPLTAMILGDLGADVIHVDPPGGPRWRHAANALLQRGKRSITLDLQDDGDRLIAQRLLAAADIAIESFRPGVATRLGIGAEASLAANPRLVYCSIPGFGEDDPRAGVPAWEGVVNAALGIYVARTPAADDDDLVFNALPIASSFAAMQASHSIAAALIARERNGRGQRVEVPLFDAGFEALGHTGMRRPDGGSMPKPAAFALMHRTMPHVGYYRCADGKWFHLCLLQERHLGWFAERYMPQEWIDEGLADHAKLNEDPEIQARGRERFEKLLATRTALEWEREINEVCGAPGTVCNTSEQWLRDDEHARPSGAVIDLDDPELGPTAQAGYPIQMSATPPQVQGPRHALDADRDAIRAELDAIEGDAHPAVPPPEPSLERALDGIKVVDLTQVLAGPTATRILAEYGASIVKINSFTDRQAGLHHYTNSGKHHILLNLKTADGMDILWKLVDGADVFHENFTKGVAERMGIGEADVRARVPDVVYSSIPAFGHEGYRAGYRGREELGQSCTGLEIRWGGADGTDEMPAMQGYALNDYGAGNWSAFAITVALFHRMRTGEGQRVHTSLAHAGTYHQIPFMVAYHGATWDEPAGQHALGWSPLDRLYRASDRWLYVAAPSPDQRARVATVPALADVDLDDAHAIAGAIAKRCAEDWVDDLVAVGVGATVVPTHDELMESDISKARGLSVEREHPGVGTIRLVGPSRRLSATPPVLTRPSGEPGHDTATVLAMVGRGDEVAALVQREVVLEQLPEGATMVGRFR